MKKYLVLLLILLFSFLSVEETNSYLDYIDPVEINTNNLKDYLDKNNLIIKEFCSYDRCYTLKEDNIDISVENFRNIYDKYLPEDELLNVRVKGYPITKIVIDE